MRAVYQARGGGSGDALGVWCRRRRLGVLLRCGGRFVQDVVDVHHTASHIHHPDNTPPARRGRTRDRLLAEGPALPARNNLNHRRVAGRGRDPGQAAPPPPPATPPWSPTTPRWPSPWARRVGSRPLSSRPNLHVRQPCETRYRFAPRRSHPGFCRRRRLPEPSILLARPFLPRHRGRVLSGAPKVVRRHPRPLALNRARQPSSRPKGGHHMTSTPQLHACSSGTRSSRRLLIVGIATILAVAGLGSSFEGFTTSGVSHC